jgi:hypothetical protein
VRMFQFAVLGLLWASAWNPAGAQGIKTKHVIEFRLAEDEARPGLIPARVAGEARIVYMHTEVVLDDGDIRTASVVKGPYGSLESSRATRRRHWPALFPKRSSPGLSPL